MHWLNEPPRWEVTEQGLALTVASGTDFWRLTHDGGIRDNGHAWVREMAGDIRASCTFTPSFSGQYDQAGLFLRADPETWIKCGVEATEGKLFAGTVVTRVASDWSIEPIPGGQPVTFRLERRGHTVEVFYAAGGDAPRMIRQTFFPPEEVALVGLMAAAPLSPGFDVSFTSYSLEPLPPPAS